MARKMLACLLLFMIALWAVPLISGPARAASDSPPAREEAFPRRLDNYKDPAHEGLLAVLKHRIELEPFNLAATLIFFAAILHTFLASKFMAIAHAWEHEHDTRIKQGTAPRNSVHHGAELFHFLGEVEVIFGLWVGALVVAILFFYDWQTVVTYISYKVNFTEPVFVVVIMILAATRPILKLSETIMARIANLFGGTLKAWWFTILTAGPLLGSLITEPAAMTISALLLARKFYELEPGEPLKYATLGLLFVNISVGGTLTHFAAPPVLMVAGPWHWDTAFMLLTFGWKAATGILVVNTVYLLVFRDEMSGLEEKFALRSLRDHIRATYLSRDMIEAEFDRAGDIIDARTQVFATVEAQVQAISQEIRTRLLNTYLTEALPEGVDRSLACEAFDQRFNEVLLYRMREHLPVLLPEEDRAPFIDPDWDDREDPVPAWVIIAHLLFMAWTIFNAHHPEIFIPGLLFFLGFATVTAPFQNRIELKPAILVGFFLGGLVIHGGVQGWWIQPVLGNFSEIPLMIGAAVLTAFNDNAAITFLSTLVPDFTGSLKYAVVAGAVTGGGLTVIANAPNPAGQSLLKKYFENGISAVGLLKAALLPTVIILHIFMIFLVTIK
ncbi:putative Na+/H+ antiporter [Desulfococcus sp.]|uniref:putative Na+/H+ antiporter n=1 Tax=Desulfococcus sp. TaxID=2025834 RepID=UPI00359462BE